MKPFLPRHRWLVAAALIAAASLANADTLDKIKSRGTLRCAVNGEVPGLSFKTGDDSWSGLDVDFCRALAAAVLGDADKVEFIPTLPADRFEALTKGRADVLARNTSWTQARELTQNIRFIGVLYYDGQSFMLPRASGKRSALELANTRVCALADTTNIDNAQRYFTRNQMPMEIIPFDELSAAADAYLEGRCDTLTTDQSQLHALRAVFPDPQAHRILPEVISREPLSPAVRGGDDKWFELARWTLFTLINAEILGIDSGNVTGARERAQSDEVRTLLGDDPEINAHLGLEAGWGARIIAAVGNYGEMFERNLGKDSGLDIKRGLNALWDQGGLLYAPPPR
ncbi:amino acid ABC transporter substrate-binding protein [Thiorhodovibrio frisius]|uniref:Periplasmic component of amino acid ABC-type transporter/signal transduction system n=1 Tax=Thiorhodovibrio frisius TaxID=631362 RepID=H8Z4L7_9GAMM|nr:amino acid ABC transporter substrate-binding protein [Thiorhodovibrio frisius]EIC20274.1 periplasmic component of amino acid ABC-type transporter/signal transduction system [Thiorhodovibrio frisius]WPL21011.1 General L-amino acid-binding periplasmic protein AapJ precursor [Thiorhodovibrio frisius]